MPQIWMTYTELGSLLGCTPHDARERAIAIHADRKRSRDGLSRVKLPPSWIELFIERILNSERLGRTAQEPSQSPHLQPQPRRLYIRPYQHVPQPTGSDQSNQWRSFANGKAA